MVLVLDSYVTLLVVGLQLNAKSCFDLGGDVPQIKRLNE
jgi:hypothetical protein